MDLVLKGFQKQNIFQFLRTFQYSNWNNDFDRDDGDPIKSNFIGYFIHI